MEGGDREREGGMERDRDKESVCEREFDRVTILIHFFSLIYRRTFVSQESAISFPD